MRAANRVPSRACARAALSLACAALAIGCAEPPRSVVLVVVDTLRADALGCYGYQRGTTPHIDRWAEGGRLFTRAYSTSPWTLPAVASLLTGQPPSRHLAGMRVLLGERGYFQPLAGDLSTLPEVLTAHYWMTGAVVNNPFLHPRSGVERGFDVYDLSYAAEGRRADESVDDALAWLAAHADQRSFLLLHLFDPHIPYEAPPPFGERYTGPRSETEREQMKIHPMRERLASAADPASEIDWKRVRDAYDEEVAFVDHELGRFFAALEERGVAEHTLVVLTSDHGEEFFDHGGFEHGHSVYDEVLRVPLLLRGPGVAAGRDDRPVSIADVPATILAAAGIERPPRFGGRSLLRPGWLPGARRPIVAGHTLYGGQQRSAIDWPWKLHWRDGGASLALFHLGRDPGEREAVAEPFPSEGEALVRLLDRRQARAAGALEEEGVAPAMKMDADSEARLRELGYLE